MILVISHRRSGTHWVIDALRNNFPEIGYRFFNLDQISPNHNNYISIKEFKRKISKLCQHVILKSHMSAQLTPFRSNERKYIINLLENNKVIYIYRDGRDVLVSLYHYMQGFRDDLPPFSDFIKMKNDLDYFYDSLNRIEYWKEHVKGWMNEFNLDIITISYEKLHSDYENIIKELSTFLGLRLKKGTVEKIEIKKYGIYRKLLRRIAPASVKSTAISPRKGVVGQWNSYFQEKDLDLFNQIAGSLMLELGYY